MRSTSLRFYQQGPPFQSSSANFIAIELKVVARGMIIGYVLDAVRSAPSRRGYGLHLLGFPSGIETQYSSPSPCWIVRGNAVGTDCNCCVSPGSVVVIRLLTPAVCPIRTMYPSETNLVISSPLPTGSVMEILQPLHYLLQRVNILAPINPEILDVQISSLPPR